MSLVFLNGEFMPQDKARISPLDRGFLFGDGVYEVIPVYKGQCFLLEEHFARLDQSLSAIQLKSPLPHEALKKIFDRLIADNGPDQCIYLQITRGPAQKRTHQFPAQITPTVFAMSGAAVNVKTQGISAITAPDIRWKFCNIKSLNLLPNVLHRQMAEEQGAEEAILIRNGLVTEGCLSNIFIVKNGVIATHPNEPGILPGITRQLLVNLAKKHALPLVEREITEQELFDADEVWSTSVGKEVTSVIEIDKKPIGSGKPGPVSKVMYELYQTLKPA
jgi:D-alanine transaminase